MPIFCFLLLFFFLFWILEFIFVEPMRFNAFMTYDEAIFLNNQRIGFKVQGKFGHARNWIIL